MSTVHIDRIDTLSAVETDGAIKSMVRKARVVGITDTDYQTLYTTLQLAGIPEYGSTPAGVGFEQLILTERSPTLVESGVMDVTLGYKHILDGNQNLNDPNGGLLYGKMSASVQQKPTNFYRNKGIGPKTQIVVAHRFPLTDTQYPNQLVVQGGEINVMIPQKNFKFTGLVEISDPTAPANAIIGAINSGVWLSEAAHTWMCTSVGWQAKKPGTYEFEYEFQHNPDSWLYYAVFNDERTGRPPQNLTSASSDPIILPVPLAGILEVHYHKEVNFTSFFGAYFEGWYNLQ